METQQYLRLSSRQSQPRTKHRAQRPPPPWQGQGPSPLPRCLRNGMEKLSGLNLQGVRVHYNSSKPAEVQAHAFAQGKDIYLAPGQERHLPHELGHVVQQTLNMVEPTAVVNGVAINDDPQLESHATELGERAMVLGGC